MPSGKRARQQRQAAPGGKTPPPVRSKSGGGGRSSAPSKRVLVIVGAVLIVGLGIGLFLALSGNGSSNSNGGSAQTKPISTLKGVVSPPQLGSLGPEGIPAESGPNVAPPASPRPNSSVDGITCGATEQLAFHVHSRLTIFVNGQQEKVPAGVGISKPQAEPTQRGPFVVSGACFSWLHTHASDGIVHIESPVQRTFTLGNFFDVWAVPLSKTQVGPVKGHVTAFYDGKVWTGDPRNIPIGPHKQIQLDVGTPLVGPENITNWAGL